MCESNKKPENSGKTQTKFLTVTKSSERSIHETWVWKMYGMPCGQ